MDEEGDGRKSEDGEEEEGEGEGRAVAIDGPDWIACLFGAALVRVETGVEMTGHGCGNHRGILLRDHNRCVAKPANLRDVKMNQNSRELYISTISLRS